MTTSDETPVVHVRSATEKDAAACAEIYRPYVASTAISFELVPPPEQEIAHRIDAAQHRHAWVVATEARSGTVLGYAYATAHRERAAYRWACDVSVYVRAGHARQGLGRTLYADLLGRLSERGYRIALAGLTLPNPASEGLHRALGFQTVGVYRRIGFKNGRWHDVLWLQRELGDRTDPPAEPV